MTVKAPFNRVFTGEGPAASVLPYVFRHETATAASRMSALPAINPVAPGLDLGVGGQRTDILVAEFVVSTVNERDHQLDSALGVAKSKAALERRLGILVTRHDFRRFSVWLTPDVQYGTIEERDWARRH